MKVVLFTDTYFPQMNGVVAYLSDAISELCKKHEVVLFAPGEKRLKVERKKNLRIYWIPSSPFPFYDGYRIASMNYKRVSDLLKKERPDVVHAHAPVVLGVQGIISARRKKIPLVITHHTHFPDYVPHLLNGKLPKAFDSLSGLGVKKLIKQVYKRADVVTAPTQELVDELSSYGLKNVVQLPNGIKLSKFRAGKKAGDSFRKKHGIAKGRKVVLYLGRVSFEKRLDILLHAFSMIEKNDLMLVIAGHGPYLENVKKLAGTLGIRNIRFTGFLSNEEVAAAYAAADVFASPSDTETFGLTFVEAMSCGLPVVGVSMFGAKEIIRSGKTGFLVPPGNTRKFAGALERLLKDGKLRKRFGAAGKERAKKYSLANSIKRTESIYVQVKKSTR
jgi:1,2-diacylglycerol 3-alpha-glucosyltransferase